MDHPGRDRAFRAGLAALLALGAFALGMQNLGRIETGAYSERITLAEARAMAQGDQRWGIVEYTHFPNGPLYVVAAMTALGLEVETMRRVPTGVFALALGFLAWALLSWTSRPSLRLWTLLACVVLLVQPAAVFWLGALHEHSYALSLSLVAVAASTRMSERTSGLLFPLGFVAGWIGYDWLPGQAVLVLGTRWLFYAREDRGPLSHAAGAALLDALKFTAGAALAVLAHLLQLALYFGSWEAASRDLLGAAAARASASEANQINPEYGRFIQQELHRARLAYERRPELMAILGADFDPQNPPRFRLAAMLYSQFLRPLWSLSWLLAAAGVVGLLVTVGEMAVAGRATARRAGVALAALGLALATAVVWTIVMPQHALSHMHMLPRHGLMAVAALVAWPVLLLPCAAGPPPGAALAWRAFLRSLAVWAAFPLLAAATYLYAAVALT